MKKFIKLFFLACMLFILFSCKVQDSNNLKALSVTILDLGKNCLNDSEINNLSKASNINKRYLTSSLYYKINNAENCFLINDKAFDYDYWNANKEKLTKNKLNVLYKSYTIDNKEFVIVYRISNNIILK